MEEGIISKKDFQKYFNGDKIIDKKDYLIYKKIKKLEENSVLIYEKLTTF